MEPRKFRTNIQKNFFMARDSVQLTAVIFILMLVSTYQPIEGAGHDPLLVVDDYKDDGIRLKCFSERLFSQVQMLWTDSRGNNITGTPLTTGTSTANVSSSIVLKPGSGNSVSCKIIDKLLKTSTESSVVIADVFFPTTSPWLAAFVVILLLSVFLVIAAFYKLRVNNKATTRALNAQKEIQQDIDDLNHQLDEMQKNFQKEIDDAMEKIDKARIELEFWKARSNAVNITLDQKYKHPSLCINEEKNRVKSSIQEENALKMMVAATEGFSENEQNEHYWEVEVGDQSEWELGVVTEEIRNALTSSTVNCLPGENLLSLQFSQGKYILTNEKDLRNCKQCSVVAVFLDQKRKKLSFYDAEEKNSIGSIFYNLSGKLYPFFSPGSDGKWLGVRPVKTLNLLPSL
ncbi:butyrophilin subfamily 3 member A3-like [Aythya fuligula]|uniref:Butyrophilin subfamily 3 member A3-like n=1 Tax=Aythya fuligula TaxID=219594 RepID=A0A6J3EBD8_AYTFU|nr:butyrophilin subfamily 3 member A3-like [Aythya fuligula]